MGEPHRYLKIGKFHRNDRDAEEHLLALLRPHHRGRTDKELKATVFDLEFGKGPNPRPFRDLHRETRERGCVAWLRAQLIGQDYFFPGGVEFAVGEGMNVKAHYAAQSVDLVGPMRVWGIEDELCDDILHFRRAACEESFSDFKACARNYRAYIFASANIVEAFLNRPTFLPPQRFSQREAVATLQKPMNFEERIALWVTTFCSQPRSVLTGTGAWSQFDELRTERNRLLHAFDTQAALEIRKLPTRLNWAREGVGGLMRTMREMQGLGTLDFIERLETAPCTEYRPSENPNAAR